MYENQERIRLNNICYEKILNDCNKNCIEKIRIIINNLIDIENEYNESLHQEHRLIDKKFVVIGSIYERDGVVGCVEGIDGWYVYCFYDKIEDYFIGLFDLYGVIKALACCLCVGNDVDFLKFTDEEEYIYINNIIHYDDFWSKKRKTQKSELTT